MELKDAVDKVESSPAFKEWWTDNKKTHFSYAFCTVENDKINQWLIGYFNKDSDKMTSFGVGDEDSNQITICPEEEIFKKEGIEVKKIELSKVNLNLEGALKKTEEFRQKKYPKEEPTKKIIILQNLENHGNVWNITFVTKTFNVLNIKISTEDGKVVSHSLSSIFSFRKE